MTSPTAESVITWANSSGRVYWSCLYAHLFSQKLSSLAIMAASSAVTIFSLSLVRSLAVGGTTQKLECNATIASGNPMQHICWRRLLHLRLAPQSFLHEYIERGTGLAVSEPRRTRRRWKLKPGNWKNLNVKGVSEQSNNLGNLKKRAKPAMHEKQWHGICPRRAVMYRVQGNGLFIYCVRSMHNSCELG